MIRTEAEAKSYLAKRTSSEGIEKLHHLASLLERENETQNLVSNATIAILWQRHFADSAQLVDHVPHGTSTVLDLGSGAGFPGIVLAVLLPDVHIICSEARTLRVGWLNKVVGELDLRNCRIASGRIERTKPVKADVITARAFAPLSKLLNSAERFSTKDTLWILPKGHQAAREVAELPPDIRNLFHVKQSATDPDAGIVIGRYGRQKGCSL